MDEKDFETARAFARALDLGDFAGARSLLAADVESEPLLARLKSWTGARLVRNRSVVTDAGEGAEIALTQENLSGTGARTIEWNWFVVVKEGRIVRIEDPRRRSEPEVDRDPEIEPGPGRGWDFGGAEQEGEEG